LWQEDLLYKAKAEKCLQLFLVYCIVSLFNDVFVLSPALRDIFDTAMMRYSLFVLNVPLNTNNHKKLS